MRARIGAGCILSSQHRAWQSVKKFYIIAIAADHAAEITYFTLLLIILSFASAHTLSISGWCWIDIDVQKSSCQYWTDINIRNIGIQIATLGSRNEIDCSYMLARICHKYRNTDLDLPLLKRNWIYLSIMSCTKYWLKQHVNVLVTSNCTHMYCLGWRINKNI